MKKLINVTEVSNEGFEKLMGERITVMCVNYFYTGELVGVNETCILLKDPAIVYETGPFTGKDWKDCQPMNVDEWYVQIGAIESFGVLK